MKVKSLHSWDVLPKEATKIQASLAEKISRDFKRENILLIAGADVGFDKASPTRAYAGVVLMEYPSLETVAEFTSREVVRFPYIPGFLSFREAPILLNLFKKISPAPDLIFFDGHGIAHPRRLGLASHMGLFLDRPAIGCAKSKLIGNFREPGLRKNSSSPLLLDNENKTIGAVVRTRDNCKPVFVSVGHQIDLESAVKFTLQCTTRYRIPEPTRRAHNLVTQFRKSFE